MRRTVDRQTLFVVLSCGLVSFIAVLSFLPRSDKAVLHTYGRFHSLGHFLLFCVLGYVAARISGSFRTRVILVVAAMIFGFGIELGECLAYLAALEWKDVFVDWAGVSVGTLIAIAVAPTKRLRGTG